MNFASLSRLALPPAPESPSLRLHRRLSAALMFLSAVLVACVTPITAYWKPLILIYPLVIGTAFLVSFLFFRRRARWQDAYWTDERRVRHYMLVEAEEARKRAGASAAAPSREKLP